MPREEKEQLVAYASDPINQANLTAAIEVIDSTRDEQDSGGPQGGGIVLRTDYSDDDAWDGFVAALKGAEKDLVTAEEDEAMTEDNPGGPGGSASAEAESESEDEDDEMDADAPESRDSTSPTSLFRIVSPTEPEHRARLTGISNLAALRLYNDVVIVRALKPPQASQRLKPGNRLMDLDGFLEVYTGDLIWIYDAQSNNDRSVRLVNQRCETYGAATYVLCSLC